MMDVDFILLLFGKLSPEERIIAEGLLNRYNDRIKHVCSSIIVDTIQVDEVISAVWEKILVSIHVFRDLKEEKTWPYICKIIKSMTAEYYRTTNKKRADDVSTDTMQCMIFDASFDEDNPEQTLLQNELISVTNQYFDSIPETDRSILSYYIVMKCSYAEIAAQLKMPKSTVASKIKRHIVTLRKLCERKGIKPNE